MRLRRAVSARKANPTAALHAARKAARTNRQNPRPIPKKLKASPQKSQKAKGQEQKEKP